MRIVFATDSHLNKHYARMRPDQLAERRANLRAAWRASIDHAIENHADLYLHGGDLFDAPNPRSAEMALVVEQFRRLFEAGIPALLLGGNHDMPKSREIGATPQGILEAARLAKVFAEPGAVDWWSAERAGLRIAVGGLVPDSRLGEGVDPLAGLAVDPPPAEFVVLLLHHSVEGAAHPESTEPMVSLRSLAALEHKVDLVLAGHIHRRHEMAAGGVKVVFPGPTERTTFGELGVEPGFLEIEVEGPRPCTIGVHHRRVSPQKMRRETIYAEHLPPTDPTGWLADRLRECSSPGQILQLRLRGALDRRIYHLIAFSDLHRLGNERNAYFDLDRRALTVQADSALVVPSQRERTSPRVEIRKVASALSAECGSEDERELVRAAERLLLSHYLPEGD